MEGTKEDRDASLPSAGRAGAGDVDVAVACREARYWGEPRSSCTSNCSVRDTPVGDRSLKNVSVRCDPGGPRIKSRSSWRERPRTAAPLTLTMTSRGQILPERSALPPGTLEGMGSVTRGCDADASDGGTQQNGGEEHERNAVSVGVWGLVCDGALPWSARTRRGCRGAAGKRCRLRRGLDEMRETNEGGEGVALASIDVGGGGHGTRTFLRHVAVA